MRSYFKRVGRRYNEVQEAKRKLHIVESKLRKLDYKLDRVSTLNELHSIYNEIFQVQHEEYVLLRIATKGTIIYPIFGITITTHL